MSRQEERSEAFGRSMAPNTRLFSTITASIVVIAIVWGGTTILDLGKRITRMEVKLEGYIEQRDLSMAYIDRDHIEFNSQFKAIWARFRRQSEDAQQRDGEQ